MCISGDMFSVECGGVLNDHVLELPRKVLIWLQEPDFSSCNSLASSKL